MTSAFFSTIRNPGISCAGPPRGCLPPFHPSSPSAAERGFRGRVFESGEAIYIPDVRSTPDFRYYNGEKPEVRSFISVPLLSKGKGIGILNVNHPEPNAFHGDSLATIRVMATSIAIGVENAELSDFAKTLADKDSLTLLHNHGAFQKRLQIELERAARHGRNPSGILLDLDGFKEINDRHGHLVGDRILMMTAGVLCAHLRKSDVAARYGGDEFAVILPETDLAATSAIAGRIAAGIAQVRFVTEEGGGSWGSNCDHGPRAAPCAPLSGDGRRRPLGGTGSPPVRAGGGWREGISRRRL